MPSKGKQVMTPEKDEMVKELQFFASSLEDNVQARKQAENDVVHQNAELSLAKNSERTTLVAMKDLIVERLDELGEW